MLETRTFKEIYASLTPREQGDLRNEILISCRVADSTIRNWKLGHRTPAPIYQEYIAKAVKKVLHVQTKASFLFPGTYGAGDSSKA